MCIFSIHFEEYICMWTLNVQVMDFPGGKVAFTPEIRFISESNSERVPCYRVLDDNGQLITNSQFVQV